jgi:hypothetical protein
MYFNENFKDGMRNTNVSTSWFAMNELRTTRCLAKAPNRAVAVAKKLHDTGLRIPFTYPAARVTAFRLPGR